MSLLGIDIGTTGCKCAAFSADGEILASAYAEYGLHTPRPGWAMLDAGAVWSQISAAVRKVTAQCTGDPVRAVATASLGEAVVPITADRQVLAESILCVDVRGEEYLPRIAERIPPEKWYQRTGQLPTNFYGITKLMWLAEHEPELLQRAWRLLPWSSFVTFMLGGEPVVDYSLAERLSCLDIERGQWATDILDVAGLSGEKLPPVAPAAARAGRVSRAVAKELGLPADTEIINGCHDQCAVAVGSGAIVEGPAACGLGTFICLTPVLPGRPPAEAMLRSGLSTEHHAAPDRFVTLIYNQGGILVRWVRDTFAAAEHKAANERGEDVYNQLFAEVTDVPGRLTALPTFVPTGPPDFLPNPSGLVAGLGIETTRGDVLKAILEGVILYIRDALERGPEGLRIDELRASGGGSRSDRWLQIAADVLQRPVTRLSDSDAGLRGAAIIAGVGSGTFSTFDEGVRAMVRLGKTFDPRDSRRADYDESFARYRQWSAAARELPGA